MAVHFRALPLTGYKQEHSQNCWPVAHLHAINLPCVFSVYWWCISYDFAYQALQLFSVKLGMGLATRLYDSLTTSVRQWEFAVYNACARWELFQIKFRPLKKIEVKWGKRVGTQSIVGPLSSDYSISYFKSFPNESHGDSDNNKTLRSLILHL